MQVVFLLFFPPMKSVVNIPILKILLFFFVLFCCCFVWGFGGGNGEGKQRKGVEIILSRKTCLGIRLAVSSSVSVL